MNPFYIFKCDRVRSTTTSGNNRPMKAARGTAYKDANDTTGWPANVCYAGENLDGFVDGCSLIPSPGAVTERRLPTNDLWFVIKEGQLIPPARTSVPSQPSFNQSAAPAPSPYNNPQPRTSIPPPNQGGPYGQNAANAGPVSRSNALPVMNIVDINPYITKLKIKCRVTKKNEIRRFSNARGEGQLLKVIVTDSTGEIPITMFGEAVDKFEPLLNEGSLYEMSKLKIKIQNTKFRTTNHICELTLDQYAEVNPIEGDDDGIPQVKYNFVPISSIENLDKAAIVDIRGIAISATPTSSILIRSTQTSKEKREINVLDESNTSICITLWGSNCALLPEELDPNTPLFVVAKDAVVDEYMGKRLSISFNSQIKVSNDMPEAQELLNWYRTDYMTAKTAPKTLTAAGLGAQAPFMTIDDVAQYVKEPTSSGPLDGKGVWFTLRCTVKSMKQGRKNFWESCVNCKKKVGDGEGELYQPQETGTKFCGTCQRAVQTEKKWICNFEVEDATGLMELSAMGDRANSIMDISCDEACKLDLNPSNEDNFGRSHDDILKEPIGRTYRMKCFARNNVYNDMKRIQYRIYEAQHLDEPSFNINELQRLTDKFNI